MYCKKIICTDPAYASEVKTRECNRYCAFCKVWINATRWCTCCEGRLVTDIPHRLARKTNPEKRIKPYVQKEELACVICGVKYYGYKNRVTCGRPACAAQNRNNQSKAGHKRSYVPVPQHAKACVICGKNYVGRESRTTCGSPTCQRTYQRRYRQQYYQDGKKK